jgi:hypothetical protein
VASLGGEKDLAVDAAERYRLLLEAKTAPVMALAGAGQPTLQSVKLDAGLCRFYTSLNASDNDRGNPGGDATVYRRSAAPLGVGAAPLPQRHGALAKSQEALTFVLDVLRGGHLPPPLGTRPLAADIPDAAMAGVPFRVHICEPEWGAGPADPGGLSVTSVDIDTGMPIVWRDRRIVDGTLEFSSPPHRPGVYRVAVAGGGYSPVSDMVLVADTRDGA